MPVPSDNLRFLRKLPKVRFDEEPRGYSKAQVDRVLENIAPIADSIEDLQRRLSEAEGRAAVAESRLADTEAKLVEVRAAKPSVAEDASPFSPPADAAPAERLVDSDFDQTLRNTLLTAQRTADNTVRDANDDAERTRSAANEEATAMVDAAKAESASLVEAARADRDSIAETVASERRRLLHDVDREADQRRIEIEEALLAAEGAERDRLLQEVTDLQQIRALLAQDIDVFESHLVERRNAVGEAISKLAGILDESDGLSDVTAPEFSEHEVVDPAQFEAVSIGLPDEVEEALEREDELSVPGGEGFLFGEAPTRNDDAGMFTDGETQMFEVVLTDDIADEDVAFDTSDSDDSDFDDSDFDNSAFDDSSSDDSDSDDSGFESVHGAFDGVADFEDAAEDEEIDAEIDEADHDEDVDAPNVRQPEGSVRPAWADAIPPDAPEVHIDHDDESGSGASDPFLDELRRATGENGEPDDATDEALSRFLEKDDDDAGRSGWFSRRK